MAWQSYMNAGGKSSVAAFEEGPYYIIVHFRDGSSYMYDENSTGPVQVREMKRLANLGQGLGSYITRVIRKSYAYKL